MSGDCETGGPHNVEELTSPDSKDAELRCVECCRVWAPLEVSWGLKSQVATLTAELAECREVWLPEESRKAVNAAVAEAYEARAENERLRHEMERASGELRHAWKGRNERFSRASEAWFDKNLISRAVQILERALSSSMSAKGTKDE